MRANIADYADVDPRDLLSRERRQPCPTRPRTWRNLDDPSQWLWASCRTYACPVCGPEMLIVDAMAVAVMVEAATDSSFCTLELAPADRKARTRAMEAFRKTLMRNGPHFEWAWITQRAPGGMVHVHLLTHGGALDCDLFSDAWPHGGVSIEPTETPMAAALYLVKDARDPLLREDARDLNGKSYLHTSRGFWGGSTKAEVVNRMRHRVRPRSSARWAITPPGVRIVA